MLMINCIRYAQDGKMGYAPRSILLLGAEFGADVGETGGRVGGRRAFAPRFSRFIFGMSSSREANLDTAFRSISEQLWKKARGRDSGWTPRCWCERGGSCVFEAAEMGPKASAGKDVAASPRRTSARTSAAARGGGEHLEAAARFVAEDVLRLKKGEYAWRHTAGNGFCWGAAVVNGWRPGLMVSGKSSDTARPAGGPAYKAKDRLVEALCRDDV